MDAKQAREAIAQGKNVNVGLLVDQLERLEMVVKTVPPCHPLFD
jgi:hypothetical protein